MGRLILVFLLATATFANSVYETNCVSCHAKIEVSIDKYFYRYLLKYSSEREVKAALKEYLNNPQKEKSVMPESFIARFGVKAKTTLNEAELEYAIDEYWQKYKVFGKLK
jgi:hypothetical protein